MEIQAQIDRCVWERSWGRNPSCSQRELNLVKVRLIGARWVRENPDYDMLPNEVYGETVALGWTRREIIFQRAGRDACGQYWVGVMGDQLMVSYTQLERSCPEHEGYFEDTRYVGQARSKLLDLVIKNARPVVGGRLINQIGKV